MTGLPLLDDMGLMAALRSSVELARSAHAEVVSVVGEMQRRGLDAGYANVAELAQADALCPSVTPTGTPVEPQLPLVARAAAEGVLSPAHLDVLVGAYIDQDGKEPDESELLERFRLPLDKKLGDLSLGQRSAFGIVIGLASRAPVTMCRTDGRVVSSWCGRAPSWIRPVEELRARHARAAVHRPTA